MIYGKRGFRKFIPTDLSWSSVYRGGYVEVMVKEGVHPGDTHNYYVYVVGTDDTAVQRWFTSWEEALELYNRLQYIQSFKDLVDFDRDLLDDKAAVIDCNGWPDERPLADYHQDSWYNFDDPDLTDPWATPEFRLRGN